MSKNKRKHSSTGESNLLEQQPPKRSRHSSGDTNTSAGSVPTCAPGKRQRLSTFSSSAFTPPPTKKAKHGTPTADTNVETVADGKRSAAIADLGVEADYTTDASFVVSPYKSIFQGAPNLSVARKRRCVLNHYEQFFKEHTGTLKSWDRMSATDFSIDNIGSFATFLVKQTAINSIDTATGYLSSVRGAIEVHPNGGRQHEVCSDDRTWSNINTKVKDALVIKAKKNKKVTLKKRAVPATLTKMNKLLKSMLRIGTRKSIHDRFLFGMQFAIMGRPYELDFLQYQHLCMSQEDEQSTVAVYVLRTKILSEHLLRVFAAPMGKEFIDYACCIFHCMFTYLLIYTPVCVSAVDKLFECTVGTVSTNIEEATGIDDEDDDKNIGTNTVARYMNRALESYCIEEPIQKLSTVDEIDVNAATTEQEVELLPSSSATCPSDKQPKKNQLTAYSCRRGAVEIASRKTQIDDVARRAGQQQSLEERKTIFEYITGTPEGDAEVGEYLTSPFSSRHLHCMLILHLQFLARTLAGWSVPDKGGYPPRFPNDQEPKEFTAYRSKLLQNCVGVLDDDLLKTLAYSGVMYYEDTLKDLGKDFSEIINDISFYMITDIIFYTCF